MNRYHHSPVRGIILLLFVGLFSFMLHIASGPVEAEMNEHINSQLLSTGDSEKNYALNNTPQIDVLVVYTAAARKYAARQGIQIQDKIRTAVSQTNQSFGNSGVNARIELVHMAEVNYSESHSRRLLQNNLYDLTKKGDGLMDEVLQWRDSYKADIVSLIVHNKNQEAYFGISTPWNYRGKEKIFPTAIPDDAFTVVQVRNADRDRIYSFAHEIGHILGAGHYLLGKTDCAWVKGSCGYHIRGSVNRDTIMSKGPKGDKSSKDGVPNRILYWSNPDVSYQNHRTGTNEANNASIINQMAPYVAAYRPTSQPSAQTQPVVSGTFNLVARHSGKCLDVINGLTYKGARVHQWDCVGGTNQLWRVESVGSYYRIVAAHSGKCLDVASSTQRDGGLIHQWDCFDVINQRWQLVRMGNHYQIMAAHSGKCLDIQGVSRSNGAYAHQWQCLGASQPNQLWSLVPRSSSTTGGSSSTGSSPSSNSSSSSSSNNSPGTFMRYYVHSGPACDPTGNVQLQVVPSGASLWVYVTKCGGGPFIKNGSYYIHVDGIPRFGPYSYQANATYASQNIVPSANGLPFVGSHNYQAKVVPNDQSGYFLTDPVTIEGRQESR